MLRATLNESVPLQVLASDGRADLYARAFLYFNAALVTSFDLTNIGNGLYGTTWTPDTEGYYSVIYQLFLDAGFTVAGDYDLESETVEVCSDKTNLLRILGLLHQDAVFDNQTYDGEGNFTGGRLRCYDSKANALSAGLTGLLFTYTITASYTGGQLSSYRITKES